MGKHLNRPPLSKNDNNNMQAVYLFVECGTGRGTAHCMTMRTIYYLLSRLWGLILQVLFLAIWSHQAWEVYTITARVIIIGCENMPCIINLLYRVTCICEGSYLKLFAFQYGSVECQNRWYSTVTKLLNTKHLDLYIPPSSPMC